MRPLSIGGLRPASVGQRLGAGVVDGAVLALLFWAWYRNGLVWQVPALDLAIAVLALAYKPLAEWASGRTVGKLFLRIRVESTAGGGIGLRSAMLRNVPYLSLVAIDIAELMILDANPAQGLRQPSSGAWFGAEAKAVIEAMSGPDPWARALQVAGLIAAILWGVLLGCARSDPHRRAAYDRWAGTVCVNA